MAGGAQQEIQQQAGKILGQVAGYVGVRTIELGQRFGLFEELSEHADGLSSDELAKGKGLDAFYAQVWCRSAYAAEVLEKTPSGKYVLAPHMGTLLLDREHPGYIGGMPAVLSQPEMFERFGERFESGQRTWWNECSSAFIKAVSGTGRPFYSRMVPNGFSQVPGLPEQLEAGARVLELACGAGVGLVKMANAYPNVSLVGLDGDAYSLELVQELLNSEGLDGRVSLQQSTLEDMAASDEYDVAFINISMHECRDIEKVTANVHRALTSGGQFVISDMPFPETDEDCRTVPARIMSGIQFFEAQIDDQLLPTSAYVRLLEKQGFQNVGSFDMTPVHCVIHGRK